MPTQSLLLGPLLGPLLGLLIAVACSPSDLAGNLGSGSTSTSALMTGEDAAMTLTPSMATVVDVGWAAPTGTETWVEYGLDSAFDQQTPSQVSSQGSHSAALLGLKAGHSYQVRVVWVDENGGRTESDPQDYDTPMYPAGLIGIEMQAPLPEYIQPGGFILLSLMQFDHDYVVILDREGDVVWWYDVGPTVITPTARMSRDGRSVMMGIYDREQMVDIGEVRRVSLRTGEEVSTRTEMGHHDFLELPDGQIAWLAYDKRLVVYGGSETDVVGDDIMIGEEGRVEGDPAETFFSFHDAMTAEVGCVHTTGQVFGLGGFDWLHTNSLAYVEDADQIVVVARYQDLILALDRTTAQTAWSLGGQDGLVGTPAPAMDHGHLSDVWDDGLLIFDNGDHRADQHSRVVEYSYDVAAGTYQLEWELWTPQTMYVEVLGDARRLPNGNRLVSWGTMGRVSEVSPDGIELWALQGDLGVIFGRVKWIDDIYAPTRGW